MSKTRDEPVTVPFTKQTCSSFAVSKRFKTKSNLFMTSLDYDDTGRYLITTSIDETLQLYDAYKGRHIKTIPSKKYGCHLAKFTHNSKEVVHASTKLKHDIRHLSVHSEEYIRYYTGHTGLVTSIEVNPVSSTFVSASMDDTVKLWDLRTKSYQASIPHRGPTHVAMDPSGQVLAVTSLYNNTASFYAVKEMAQFGETIHLPKGLAWNRVEFSNDNKYILFSATNAEHVVLDAFTFEVVARLSDVEPMPDHGYATTGSATFSPDGRYVFGGNGAKGKSNVAVWGFRPEEYASGRIHSLLHPVWNLMGDFRPRLIAFNPKFMQFATGDSELSLWIPDLD